MNDTNMEHFDINGVIRRYGLDPDELARALFPKAKYPRLALDRIIKGEGSLDVARLEALAAFAGVLVTDLFTAGDWKGSSAEGHLSFIKGPYEAKLNYNGVYLTVLKDGIPVGQSVSNVPAMTVQEFINYLDNFINNYENGTN